MTFFIWFGSAAIVSMSCVALEFWWAHRQSKKKRSQRWDKEYLELCQDPRYKVR
jgi:hypothetical protein